MRFEGVIGDFIRKYIWDAKSEELYMRPQACTSVIRLKQKFQIVMTTCLSPEQLHDVTSV